MILQLKVNILHFAHFFHLAVVVVFFPFCAFCIMSRKKATISWATTTNTMRILFLIIILLGRTSSASTTSVATASSSDHISVDLLPYANTAEGLVSFPLIPHHVQRSRRGLLTTTTIEENYYNYEDGEGGGDHHHHRRHRRRRDEETSSDPKQMGAVYQGYGTHYVDLWCGTPPQRQTVIIDTGSGLTAFPCSGCEDCGAPDHHTDNYFENDQSSTFQKSHCSECTQRAHCNARKGGNECRVNMSYSEGSTWKAYEGLDTCYVGGFHNKALLEDNGTDDMDPGHAKAFGFPLRFGCQTTVTGLFKTQLADGIMGMEDSKSSFWHQMFNAKKIDHKQFSLCYTRPIHTFRSGTGAGAMTLGGTDKRLHTSSMVYSTTKGTPSETKKSSGYFNVHIRNFYWRDGAGGDTARTKDDSAVVIKLKKGSINRDGVIVDSGTTDTYLSSVIQFALEKNFKRLSGRPFNNDKVVMSQEEINALPTLLLQLAGDQTMNQKVVDEYGGGDVNNIPTLAGDFDPEHPLDVIVAVPPSHYIESISGGRYVNRIYDAEEDGTVLGANVMMGHDILFDATNKRIGWAESSCDYNGLISENGYAPVLSLSGGEVEVFGETPEEEGEMAEEQEETKEIFDEENTETEIHEEETIEAKKPEEVEEKENFDKQKIESETQEEESIIEMQQEDGKETFDEFKIKAGIQDGMEVKKKKPVSGEDTHNYDNPINDIKQQMTDNPAIAGGGLVIILILCSVCCFCMYRRCCAPRKKKTYRRVAGPEIEMNGRSSFKDDFVDEHDDEDAEYGEYKDV